MRRLIIPAVAIATVALVASASVAGPHGSDRPFKGRIEGTTTAVPVDAATFMTTSTGTGRITHLGRCEYGIEAIQDWSGAVWPDDPCATVEGTMFFVAANGDSLYGMLMDGSEACELDPFDDTTYSTSLRVQIMGGTGRFVHASGWFMIHGRLLGEDPPTGIFEDSGRVMGRITWNRGGGGARLAPGANLETTTWGTLKSSYR